MFYFWNRHEFLTRCSFVCTVNNEHGQFKSSMYAYVIKHIHLRGLRKFAFSSRNVGISTEILTKENELYPLNKLWDGSVEKRARYIGAIQLFNMFHLRWTEWGIHQIKVIRLWIIQYLCCTFVIGENLYFCFIYNVWCYRTYYWIKQTKLRDRQYKKFFLYNAYCCS